MATKPMVIRLTEAERAELERRRAAGGYRSLNETVRAWLAPMQNATTFGADYAKAWAKREMEAERLSPACSVPLASDIERKPYQKGAKK